MNTPAARIIHRHGDDALDNALIMRLKALKINRMLGSRSGVAEDCNRLGILYALRQDLKRSESLLKKALKLERQLDRSESLANCCYNLAAVLAARDRNVAACDLFQEALSIDHRLGNIEGCVHSHLALTTLFIRLGNIADAQMHLDDGLVLTRQSCNDCCDVAGVLSHIAALLLKIPRAEQALDILDLTRNIYERRDKLCGLAEVTALLGVAHHLTGKPVAAKRCLQEAIKLNRALDRSIRLADCHANLANIYWSNGRIDTAEGLYRQALTLFINEGCRDEAQGVRQLLNDLPHR